MCLFYDDDYEEVMRKLVGSLQDMRSWSDSWHVPTASAISQARARLGPEPMKELFERTAVPLAELGTKGAWLGSRRLMAVDGTVLEVPETPENVTAFRFQKDHPRSSYPQVQLVGLGECGSHAIVAAAFADCRTGEQTLLPQLIDAFEPDMLVMADRGFYGYDLWQQALQTGAALLWRVASSILLPVLVELTDGSYLSVVFRPNLAPRLRGPIIAAVRAGEAVHPVQAIVVRVVEYDVPDRIGNGKNETIKLITSILDPTEVSAIELAGAYHERWEIEAVFDEIKTHQRGPTRILRSRSPDLVEQEIWSLLLTHYAIRALMCRAADEADADSDRLSFLRTLRVIRRHITGQADFSP